MSEFEKVLGCLDSRIFEAQHKTECERIEHYEQFGFTEEDYRETKAIADDFFTLWHAPELAKKRGITPQELVAKVTFSTIGAHLSFPGHVLRGKDGVK